MSYLVRSWNVFHGRTHPSGRHAYLEEAVRLAARDGPDVLCLQEVPVWGLSELGAWSGMTTIGQTTMMPGFGPLRLSAELARWLTDLHHGVLRSLFTGQANAVLVGPRLRVLEHRSLVLNDRRFRKAQARRLDLDLRRRLAWTWQRRVCQAVRVALPDGRTMLILNVHASHLRSDSRLADAELLRAADFADELANPGETILFAGDFNVTPKSSAVLGDLTGPGRFSSPASGIDHILVRGTESSSLEIWPDKRRRLDGRLLSDHAPVELYVE